MNRCRTSVFLWGAALGSLILTLSINRACAQASAFTYQGHLLGTNGQPASGGYDFQFKLRDSGSNQVGSTLTNAPVVVSNGLFTTTLDFTDTPLDGTPRFLEIGIRTNGSAAAYTILSPTQPLNSAPYAYRADVATTFPGGITDSQLSANVPLLNGNPIFTGLVTLNHATGAFSGTFNGAASGTFSGASSGTFNGVTTGTNNGTFVGNGAGITGVNITNVVGTVPGNTTWQVVQTTTQSGQSDFDYLTTNAGLDTVTLPASPNVGDTIRISGAGPAGWIIGQNAGQSIVTGSLGLPAGRFWTGRASSLGWQSVASSADGSHWVAAVNNGPIYTSVDSGNTWTAQTTGLNWYSVASSSDGTHLAAVVDNGDLYTSTNSGTNWSPQFGPGGFYSVASSSDGTKLAAVVNNGLIYTSVNSGISGSWVSTASALNWYAITSSGDGVTLAAVVNNGQIWTSYDSGNTWSNRGPVKTWVAIASSTSGTKMVAVANNDYIYTSGDSGANWTQRNTAATTHPWTGVACSGDGKSMLAVAGSDDLFSSFDGGQTWTARTSAFNWQCVGYSANGSRAVAGVKNGLLYNSPSTTTVGTAGFLSGIQYSAVELQYIGNGQWMPLSFSGSFSAN